MNEVYNLVTRSRCGGYGEKSDVRHAGKLAVITEHSVRPIPVHVQESAIAFAKDDPNPPMMQLPQSILGNLRRKVFVAWREENARHA